MKSPAAGPAAAIRPAPEVDSPAAAMPDEVAVAAGVGGRPSTPEAPAPSPSGADPRPPSPPPFVPRAQPRPRAGEDVRVAAAPPGLGAAIMPAPDPALIERTGVGPLPRVSPDGRKPWRVYARPF
ncbi:MAG TPA: divergent polysaccharide deacetylase family protein, partial [Alphaproteobacteria bacterium]